MEAARSSGEWGSYTRLLWAGPLAGIVVAAANAVVYFVSLAFRDIPESIEIPNIGVPLSFGAVISFSFVPALLAVVLLAIPGRFTRRPVRKFLLVVMFVASLYAPFTIPGTPVAMVLALLLMPMVAAVAVTAILAALACEGKGCRVPGYGPSVSPGRY